uniref:Uncharacterized protein n=1 Tax=Timema poppense TaxID=170557 RepID=A0A7R9DU51_TIMPO|nr:unnamed protein product [Timema poppensis]
MIGPAIMLIVITQVGCDTSAIIVLLIVTMVFNGAFFGGSMLNHMDIAINFAGSLAAFSGTIVGLVHIMAPTIAGAITNNQETRPVRMTSLDGEVESSQVCRAKCVVWMCLRAGP